jgi:coenzyme F420 hydrogenase subunit beta
MATATAHDGRTAEMTYERSWGHHLSREVQFRCKICPDAVGGVADIACADAWYGGETGYPTFEEQSGRSLVVTRTAVGEAFWIGQSRRARWRLTRSMSARSI